MTRTLLGLSALALLGACTQTPPKPDAPAQAASTAAIAGIPAGEYRADPAHSSLTFKVGHLGYSNFTASFDKIDAVVKLDPANPAAAQVTASVDPRSLDLPAPPKGFHDELMGAAFFDAAAHPKIEFVSSKVDMTGADTAKITGNLTMRGVTRPVTFDATFNGGYPGFAMDPQARVGFSLTGRIKRSDFGMSAGIPAPGSDMGVTDEVDIAIETELLGPPLKPQG
ncbi:yceI-like domain protein [Asticcacaulis biprosthecium C19]|uniref:YceI-like domain protein n=1 Tax=Asticcacaulis biprosthecium C19 TaxID=715226 RepID=F4QKY6_9CAUL|nr:YceI family protein [Asticcacaulis biprosthecium]EGF92209.1 yceI-like domain protein [Asticcacaulis biprosthecium C19]